MSLNCVTKDRTSKPFTMRPGQGVTEQEIFKALTCTKKIFL
jgi:hypothetical protein